MAEKLFLITDPQMLEHNPTPGHPESPARLEQVTKTLRDLNDQRLIWRRPDSITTEELLRAHERSSVDEVLAMRGEHHHFDADTAVAPGSIEASLLSAGAARDAVDLVMKERGASAFALGRPPGHHAERGRAMGFCLFNNIAVAAAHALVQHKLERVLVLDWDVHHGNGTQQIFDARRDVLFISSHQWPLYPGTGALSEMGWREGAGYTVNLPVPGGFGDAELALLYDIILRERAAEYQPQLVLISAGYDAHQSDPLGGLRMTEAGFAYLTWLVRRFAEEHCEGRIAFCMEGGYNLNALASSIAATCQTMLSKEAPPAPDFDSIMPASREFIDRSTEYHLEHRPKPRVSRMTATM